jgi:hypothetical protein
MGINQIPSTAVTSVTAGSSKISIGGTTTAPTVDLGTSGATAGSYTLSSITVDASGRVTAASNGSVSAGAYTLISSGSMSGVGTLNFTSLASGYQKLALYLVGFNNSYTCGSIRVYTRVNGDTGCSYRYGLWSYSCGSAPASGITNGISVCPNNSFGANQNICVEYENYAGAGMKYIRSFGVTQNAPFLGSHSWANSSAVTSVSAYISVGTWNAGNYYLYGVK